MRTTVHLIMLRSMGHLFVLFQDGQTSIQLVTHLAFMPFALLAGLLMLLQHLLGGQRFKTLAARVSHTLMHIHVPPHPVCSFKHLVAHRTFGVISTHSRQAVRYGLCGGTSSSRGSPSQHGPHQMVQPSQVLAIYCHLVGLQ